MRLQDVLGGRGGFGAFAAPIDVGHDGDLWTTGGEGGLKTLFTRSWTLVTSGSSRIATAPPAGSAAHISLPASPPPCTLSLAMWETTVPWFDPFAISAVKTGIPALFASTMAEPIATCESYGVSTIAATFWEMKSST